MTARSLCALLLTALACLGTSSLADAHEVRPGYLEFVERSDGDWDVTWKVPLRGQARLRIDPIFPESFERVTVERAFRTGDAYVTQWRFRIPDGLVGQEIGIEGLQRTLTDALLRIGFADGRTIAVRLKPNDRFFTVPAEPSTMQLGWTYLVLGVEHILGGIDHLLFVLALLLIVGSTGTLVKTVTSFTIAHSITLALATLGFVYMPGPPVEAVIALSIVFVASELVHRGQGRVGLTERHPWVVAFTFGLLHGFGFAGALHEVGLPQGDIPLALFTFNVGVEAGQLMFVAAVLVVRWLAGKLPVTWPRWGWKVAPYGIGSIAAFWVIERVLAF